MRPLIFKKEKGLTLKSKMKKVVLNIIHIDCHIDILS